MFKTLRSIAENLFDEDDKYRILYADNKKVQQRILSRIGGYECKLDPAKENNMETDAGLCETEGHFKQKRETFHANASRKRSLSWPAKEQMEKEKKQHAFIHKNTNYYKHQYTLPPKHARKHTHKIMIWICREEEEEEEEETQVCDRGIK
eukprot:263814_1